MSEQRLQRSYDFEPVGTGSLMYRQQRLIQTVITAFHTSRYMNTHSPH